MKIVSIGNTTRAYHNAIYVSISKSNYKYIQLNGYVFKCMYDKEFNPDELGLSSVFRQYLNLNIGDDVDSITWHEELPYSLPTPSISFQISITKKMKLEITAETLTKLVQKSLNKVFVHKHLVYIIDYVGCCISLKVDTYTKIDDKYTKFYYIDPETTNFIFDNQSAKYLIIEQPVNEVSPLTKILDPNFSFEQIGVGGLDGTFLEDFRRTFATRLLPTSIIREMGISYVKGLLLYGVPGCGKTRLARSLSELIGASSTKVVNGPECLDKYVGSSEQKIRDLFKDAEDDYKQNGDKAKLHVIIFDEIDAICKSRGSNPSSLTDSVVNQLLTKIDGVESVPNIFIIGMTNIPEVIDKALIRPGRLELKLEVGLPDYNGRIQILTIHTKKLKESGRLNDDFDVVEIANETTNYTGAELESIVKNAVSIAILANHKVEEIKITQENFLDAIKKVIPNFGVPDNLLDRMITLDHTMLKDNVFEYIKNDLVGFFEGNNSNTKLFTVIIEENNQIAINKAALLAKESCVQHIKYLCPKQFLHLHGDHAKANEINKILNESIKAPESLIIIDSIDKICEFIANGRSFSSIITHTLSTWIKVEEYHTRNKMAFIITISSKHVDFLHNYLDCPPTTL